MRITPWKKVAVATAVVAASIGTGAAWAQSNDNPGSGSSVPQGDVRMMGGGTTETKFVPIEPCRLVDTRSGGGGKFANGDTRYFDVRGTGSTFANQGGKTNGCGIPNSGVSAVEVTISAVDATGKGFLRAFPRTAPAATFLSYPGGTDVGNTGTVALCGSDGGICILDNDLGIKNYSGSPHVIVDVFGYYAQPISIVVEADGRIARGSRNATVTTEGVGVKRVLFDRNLRQCAYSATVGRHDSGVADGFASASPLGTNVNGIYVKTFDKDGNIANLGFHLTVTC